MAGGEHGGERGGLASGAGGLKSEREAKMGLRSPQLVLAALCCTSNCLSVYSLQTRRLTHPVTLSLQPRAC